MKILRHAYAVLCSNLTMTIIVILQMAASLVMLNMMTGYAAQQYKFVKMYSELSLSREPGLNMNIQIDSCLLPDEVIDRVTALDPAVCRESGEYFNTTTAFGDSVRIQAYSNGFVRHYKPKMKSGVWLSELPDDGRLYVVLADDGGGRLRVGGNLKLAEGVNAEIAGILDQPYFYSLDVGGAELSPAHFLAPNTDRNYSTVYLARMDDLRGCADAHKDVMWKQKGVSEVFIFSNEKYLAPAREILKDYGNVLDFSQMMQNGKDEAFAMIRMLSPFFIFMLLVSLIGMIGCTALSSINNFKRYAILYICGASMRDCCRIAIAYTAMFSLAAVLLFAVVYVLCGYTFYPANIAVTLGVVLLGTVTAAVPIGIFKRSSPIGIIRNAE